LKFNRALHVVIFLNPYSAIKGLMVLLKGDHEIFLTQYVGDLSIKLLYVVVKKYIFWFFRKPSI